MATLLLGMFVGITMGAVGTLVVYADPLRRKIDVLHQRIIREQMRTFAAEARLHSALYFQKHPDAPGHDEGSLNVTPIHVVPEPLI